MEKRNVTVRVRRQNSVKSDALVSKKWRAGGLLPSCVTGEESRRNKDRFSPVNPPVPASDSIKGHNSVDSVPNASEMFLLSMCLCVCVCFVLVCFWKNRESNTFKGWRKFSSIYLGQWNIHHTESQTLHRIKDQRSYTSRRSKNRCLWGYQTSNGLSTAPLTPLPSPTDRTELGGPPHGTCQPPKCD